MPSPNTIARISGQTVYKGHYFNVCQDQVQFPNQKQGTYDYIKKTDFILAIPFIQGHFYLVEQYRYPIQMRTIEFPQGSCESEETSHSAAHRELVEEIGFSPNDLKILGHLHLGPGMFTQGFDVYLTQNGEFKSQQLESTESDIKILAMTLDEINNNIFSVKITDSPTIAAFQLFNLWQKRGVSL